MSELTREYILSMPIGRELDQLVDKFINKRSELFDGMTWFTPKGEVEREYPAYSSVISAAWELVRYLRNEHGYRLHLELKNHTGCYIWLEDDFGWNFTGTHEFAIEEEGICKIALLAVIGL